MLIIDNLGVVEGVVEGVEDGFGEDEGATATKVRIRMIFQLASKCEQKPRQTKKVFLLK